MYKIEERILTDSNMKASELIGHLKSYIDAAGGDCEMFVFDKAEGVSYDIKNTSTNGDNIFLHVSSETHFLAKKPM